MMALLSLVAFALGAIGLAPGVGAGPSPAARHRQVRSELALPWSKRWPPLPDSVVHGSIELHADGSGAMKGSRASWPRTLSQMDVFAKTRKLGWTSPDGDADGDHGVSGVCRPTSGVQTTRHNIVRILADLTDCGPGVKQLGAFPDASSPLQSCAQKVDEDDECGLFFQLEDETFTCSCMTGSASCPERVSTTTCAYQLVPPVCGNTTGLQVHAHNAVQVIFAVYPLLFVAGCANATSLGIYPDGLQSCANEVANNPACGNKFTMHRTTFACTCLKPGSRCDTQDDADTCLYDIAAPVT